MSAILFASVLRRLGRLAAAGEAAQASDGQLLQRFLSRHDEAAFAALVQRHGPMVLGVVRRVLKQEQDAEDAFQAAFLVLARRAAAIAKQNSVGSWLHGVALRVALKAKVAAARRRWHERQALPMTHPSPEADLAWQELQAVLDEELQRLPETYRAPFVLCCLEGKSKAEAARELGWTSGTVSGRLARARERLRARLRRRGVALSAAALATLLAGKALSAAVPPALADTAVRAATASLPGAAAGAASARAASLAEGVIRGMALTKLRVATGAVLVLALLAGGAGLLARHALVATGAAAGGLAPPAPDGAADRPVVDRQGDPLPEGVAARLGTVRFREGGWVDSVAFSPDGKALLASSNGGAAAGTMETGVCPAW
jgi:RNA polymerase sigma factor (sigma-70 family)